MYDMTANVPSSNPREAEEERTAVAQVRKG